MDTQITQGSDEPFIASGAPSQKITVRIFRLLGIYSDKIGGHRTFSIVRVVSACQVAQ